MSDIRRARAIGRALLYLILTTAAAGAVVFATFDTVRAASLHSVAERYQGLHERRNNRILRHLIGVNPARIPWCGYFAAAVVKKAGKTPPRGYPSARSWRRYGHGVRLSRAKPGDVVVLRFHRWHVGIFDSRRAGRVCVIGGNQSNRVKRSCYPASRVRAVRR